MLNLPKVMGFDGMSRLYSKLKADIDALQDASKNTYQTKTDAANTYQTKSDTAANYLKKTDASSTYLSKSDAASIYPTKSNVETNYLKKTDAANTYQTKSDTAASYLKKTDAADTYQTKTDAENTYQTKTDAANTYQTKTDATANYLKKDDASSTYLSKADAENTYLAQDDAVETYLAQSTAANTYQTKTDATTNYLKKTDAANTYLAQSTAANTYLLKTDATANYLKKTDAANTYATKQALNDAIGAMTSISYSVVNFLPSSGSDGVIYLVPKTSVEENNSYYEYIWIKSTSKFEKIGDTTVDLSGYLKNDTAANTYLSKADASNNYLSKTDAANTYLSKTDASNTYATKSNVPTKISQLVNDSGYKTTDYNTTYTLTQDSTDGHKLTFAGSDGTSKTVTIPDNNTIYGIVTTSTNGLMSSTDKSKLDGIAANANNYTLPAATASTLGGVKVGSNITVSSGVISLTKANVTGALGYTPPTTSAATQSAAGLMSAADKTKLDGIAEKANNYTYTLPAATASTLGGVKVGSNITVSSGTISLTKANVTAALGYTPPTKDTDTHYASGTIVNNSNTATANTTAALTNGNVYLNHIENGTVKNSHKISGSGATSVTTDTSGNITISSTNTTYSAATQSANGLMTAADKKKLDGIASGANAYTLPAATSSALGGVKVGSNITVSSGTISLTKDNVTAALGYTPPTTNTTYGVATTSANGLMSAADKTKLDGVATGANKYTLPVATSSALGGVKSGTDITVDSSGNVSVNDDSHNHVIDNVDGLQSAIDSRLPLSGGTMTGSIITPKNDSMGIIPDTNNYGQIGSSDKKFYRMYATTFYGNLSGNATSATKLATARTIALSGAVSGSASFNGTGNITITTKVQAGTSAPSSLANGAIYCVYEA